MVDTEEWRQESLDRGVFVVEVKNVNRGCEDDFAHTLRYLSLGPGCRRRLGGCHYVLFRHLALATSIGLNYDCTDAFTDIRLPTCVHLNVNRQQMTLTNSLAEENKKKVHNSSCGWSIKEKLNCLPLSPAMWWEIIPSAAVIGTIFWVLPTLSEQLAKALYNTVSPMTVEIEAESPSTHGFYPKYINKNCRTQSEAPKCQPNPQVWFPLGKRFFWKSSHLDSIPT